MLPINDKSIIVYQYPASCPPLMNTTSDRTLETADKVVNLFSVLVLISLILGAMVSAGLVLVLIVMPIMGPKALPPEIAQYVQPSAWFVGAGSFVQTWLVYKNLTLTRMILASVRKGIPFTQDNVQRLNRIAAGIIAFLAIDIVNDVIRILAGNSDKMTNFSFSSWFVALMLLVIAQVFAHGVRMRTELEGVV